MRVIVFGTGAIGGAVAAALARSGADVTAIARGTQLDAIRERGLRLRTPEMDEVIQFDVVGSPEEAKIGPDDAILLTMKGQHTQAALEQLRDAGATTQPIFCLQNGVANEGKALRLFPNVHGVTVIMPTTFVTAGEVVVEASPAFGIFYTGRYPGGAGPEDEALASILSAANIACFPRENVMASKYGKLILNLGNILGAALGPGADVGSLRSDLRAEAEAVFRAVGIEWEEVGADHPDRKTYLRPGSVPGFKGVGTSTAQSLVRGTGSLETDWLNGEVSLLGRLHGIATPANDACTRIGARMVREGLKPGDLTLDDLMREVAS
ncbi:ketopantoate reductase family protein [Maritimibacter sp. DP1N21-5]|uniref:ketopantoate reductase family protein n=1 Tax=Maritimibacter sp. DP1N21-5 TaxID=2836867 RepID=UPI001C47DA15|nr:2-dehydropantoate 2-reductase N-terminal domain-containing protein [Maritimibacter sp. DP1N21-5]MBV7410967.1 ketopantoate reductase family protein [Maritimibacter sp. DP1N21-5]